MFGSDPVSEHQVRTQRSEANTVINRIRDQFKNLTATRSLPSGKRLQIYSLSRWLLNGGIHINPAQSVLSFHHHDTMSVPVVNYSYYPPNVVIDGYVANTLSTTQILAIFTSTLASVLVPCFLLIRRVRPSIPTSELATALWFVLCGVIHLGLEGHYARHQHHIGASSHVLSQLWKEYALSDSRYLTRDSFVACMEGITAAFWGPLSFLCAYGVVRGSAWRHPLQSIVSLGQLYGDVLYYATCTYEFVVYGQEFSRPEPYYFIGYYVFLNAFWIVIPSVLLLSSGRATTRAFAALERRDKNP
ncbi:3-beta-hydroxysteroid-Delta(8), Delta(7)-isomerase [Beauveria bassiana ARSEF 2860]|uniref:3-beta-hydroxysteroid-Delta(8), Delta(7)-isomerase n=1 Tax=Beauveria bassiana (strain ARSEF 2860) TaxID=655819 RepID=J4KNJ5_BEAB2|nr:3-beta-hydroxysteroid-Delta(8), Delta(7)-isomerase [Beauveria bassiana ARSEF 2860]EJP65814.1 3-beta-hydroxysteroid-Delta(8), Delta(7)-isomerase [Beauveria bassiana ARSEF 2860]